MQVTLMSIPAGGNIGLEVHPHTDQFICIENGCALAIMGKSKDSLCIRKKSIATMLLLSRLAHGTTSSILVTHR